MEIEKKFLVNELPVNLSKYEIWEIEQCYLCTAPTIRIRKKNDSYILTYKNHVPSADALCVAEETELPLTKKAFEHLKKKCDGRCIQKSRYRIPYEKWVIELDVFHGDYEGFHLAEVEFPSEEAALAFPVPDWFTCEVTYESTFHNSRMITVNPELLLSTAATRLSS